MTTSCAQAQWYGGTDPDGGQGRLVRVPPADGTLVATPQVPDRERIPALPAGAGRHARRERGPRPELPMDRVAEAYAAMDERRSIKTLLWP